MAGRGQERGRIPEASVGCSRACTLPPTHASPSFSLPEMTLRNHCIPAMITGKKMISVAQNKLSIVEVTIFFFFDAVVSKILTRIAIQSEKY